MSIKVEYKNLNEVLDKNAKEYADKTFVRYDDKILTFKEFREKVLRLANVFISLGAKKGDFIGIQLTNSIEFCVAIYACYRIGAIATPIISLWKTKEVAEAMERAQLEIMIVKGTLANIVWNGIHYWAYTKDYDTGKWYHNDGYNDVYDKEIVSDENGSAEEKVKEIFEKNRYIKENFIGRNEKKPKVSVANVLFYVRAEKASNE